MKPYIQTKYVLKIIPKESSYYNPLHEKFDGREAGIIDVPVGERGWIFCKNEDDVDSYCNPWHRIHLSPIENVEEDENGNIHITTLNTYYHLIKVNLI